MKKKVKTVMIVAAISGALSVGFGAFGAHALKGSMSVKEIGWFELAVRYQMWHSLALLGIGLCQQWLESRWLNIAAGLLLAGSILFCGSLYGLSLRGPHWFVILTPLGGSSLLFGWLAFVAGLLQNKSPTS